MIRLKILFLSLGCEGEVMIATGMAIIDPNLYVHLCVCFDREIIPANCVTFIIYQKLSLFKFNSSEN